MTDQVLLIEDDDALRASLVQTLELAGLSVAPANGYVQAKRKIRANFPGIVLCDIRMPHQDGFAVLQRARSTDSDLPVLLMTGYSDVPSAVRAMREGAYDYLEKPVSTDRLLDVVRRALEHRTLVLKTRRIEQALMRSDAAATSFPGSGPVSSSLREVLRQVAGLARHVHLSGQEGAGKRRAAAAINAMAAMPRVFLKLSLQIASPDALARLEVPDGPADLSLKSLHLITPGQARDLAGLVQRHPDLRILSSSIPTMAELLELAPVADLFASLDPVEILIPSLAERREDLPEIFNALLINAARSLNTDTPELPDGHAAEIMLRDWPGNLPEVQSYAATLALGQQVHTQTAHQTLASQMDAFERMVLIETLRRTDGRASQAAAALGLPRNTFYDRLARYNLQAKDFRSAD